MSRIKDLVEALFELNLPTSYESDNVFMEDSSDNSTDHLAEDQEVTLEMELYNAIKLANDEGVMRVFSSANYICSKIRSRLGDEILDVLVFLRSQFRLKR